MLNNTNFDEDTKNIKLIDKPPNQTCDSNCWFYILQCLCGLCLVS
jgi:hypothetical protein